MDREYSNLEIFLKRYLITILKIICYIILILLLITWLKKTENYNHTDTHNIQIATQATRLIYDYTDIDTINKNAKTLSELCTPEAFSAMDNTDPAVLTSRFSKYCITKCRIEDVFSNIDTPDTVYVIVNFDIQTNLEPKLLKFKFTEGLISEYREYYIGTKVNPLNENNRSIESFIEGCE